MRMIELRADELMTLISRLVFSLCGTLLLMSIANPLRAAETADVIVVGATPGGIAAAVSAARAGRSVIVLEPQQHPGGMMTSGLGKSDIENRAMIGGLFKEFTGRIHDLYLAKYGRDSTAVELCHEGYYYEPSVAEIILKQLIAEQPRISMRYRHVLFSANVSDRRLTSVRVLNRLNGAVENLSAKIFIDATYEGDLFAAAGAEFRVGRESRQEFQEAHAGVIYFDYQQNQFLPGSTGESDDRIPAYTYRRCLTTDPANSVALPGPPPGYDRRRYVGYFDDLKDGRMAGPKVFKPGRGYYPAHFNTMVRALSATPLPNEKLDVNINPRLLGFPFAEENQGYLTANHQARELICENHRNLTLGLLWFLQNDEEIPEAHRELARKMQLPRDEFQDNNHFPFQLYVREGRRLKGLYTLKESDITGDSERREPIRHRDSIAVGEFPIDSFPCRKRQSTDSVILEGYLGMLDRITRPYEIPYRILIPEQIDGLIVPVAASTTHVAYSSIRVEPTWMAIGQAAGTAAHLAIEQQVQPRDLPIEKLQRSLLQDGQVIHHQ